VKAKRPEVIFLAEAFTRPRLMYRLAKIGFTQSYTYFTWREAKWELEQYMDELTTTEVADYFRPNFWPNTPDILPPTSSTGTRRLLVAPRARRHLVVELRIYGPAFELQEHVARQEGSEEYAHSEKYAIRNWDRERPDSLAGFIGRVNRIRHENPALHHNRTLRFHHCANDALLCYSKTWLVDPGCYLGEGVTHARATPTPSRRRQPRPHLRAVGHPRARPRRARARSRPALRRPRPPHRRPLPVAGALEFRSPRPSGVPPTSSGCTTRRRPGRSGERHTHRTDRARRGGRALVQRRRLLRVPCAGVPRQRRRRIGDFRGLIEKLDYIQELGITAIWLLPFYPSPLRDDGYESRITARSTPPTGHCATSGSSCAKRTAAG